MKKRKEEAKDETMDNGKARFGKRVKNKEDKRNKRAVVDEIRGGGGRWQEKKEEGRG